jgi:DNA (cytosine-5)-methyltransferase 1
MAMIRLIPKNGGSRMDLPMKYHLPCHKRFPEGFKDVYGRMKWSDVSPTITGGCVSPSKGRFLHPSQNRAISLREAALLQTFPQNYYFSLKSGRQGVALMIGNALPPTFIKRHALAIKHALVASQ